MNADLFLALLLFAVVSSVTPGPNNLMLMTSGVNFGVRRSLPHLLGINVGFPLMIGLLGLGLGAIFLAYPAAHTGLRILSMLYLLYLAWKIATAGPVQAGEEGSKPMSFLAAAMFQWVNPKAWIMAVSAIATYTVSGNYALTLAIVMLVFMLVGGPSSIAWVMFGAGLRRFLGNPRVLRIFNVSMAVLLILSMLPVLLN